MPIEDINYLYQNSTKESMIVLIDSSKRDLNLFPKVGDFQINFEEPFTFVYGIEILNTTIPRTMFMVEKDFNDTLIYKHGNDLLTNTEISSVLKPQDFRNSDQFFITLNYIMNKDNPNPSEYFVVTNSDIYYNQHVSNDDYYERTNTEYPIITFKKNEQFYLDMTKSTIETVMGFNSIPSMTDFVKYTTLSEATSIVTNISKVKFNLENPEHSHYFNIPDNLSIELKYVHNSITCESFLNKITTENDICTILIDGNVYTNQRINLLKNQTYTILIYKNNITKGKILRIGLYYSNFINIKNLINNNIFLANAQIDSIGNDQTTVIEINPVGINPGEYIIKIGDLFYNKNTFYYNYAFVGTLEIGLNLDSSYINDSVCICVEIVENNSYTYELDMFLYRSNTNTFVYTNPDPKLRKTFFNSFIIKKGFDYKFNCPFGFSINKIDITPIYVGQYMLTSPGMLNLASENYVVMRCEEIENHLRGSHNSEDTSPGIGLLDIAVQGYAESKNEFYSVKYKEFHPIGRLSKMHFKFERKKDKQIYDFKNVNLHFLMSVKFYRPSRKETFQRSILNPEYDMNFIKYNMFSGSGISYEEPSSDEEEDIDDDHAILMNERENEILRYI
jgi:hypothetical protein